MEPGRAFEGSPDTRVVDVGQPARLSGRLESLGGILSLGGVLNLGVVLSMSDACQCEGCAAQKQPATPGSTCIPAGMGS